MKLDTMTILSCKGATNKKEYREHLRAICFDFDQDSKKLNIIGTNAQCMIINSVKIKDEDFDFCKKYFSDNSAYLIDDKVLDPKQLLTEFTEIDNRLVCNGVLLVKLDMQYPNWRCIVPGIDLCQATAYCGWSPDLIKQVDKALGWKNQTIMTRIPRVNAKQDREYLNPHRWDLEIYTDCDTTVLIMPMRIEK